MMCSSAKVFSGFVSWLLSLGGFSESKLLEVLEEFDGVQGVVGSGLYISAYEEIARYLARIKTFEEMIRFFELNCERLCEQSEEQYYFVESVIDVYAVGGLDVLGLIDVSPVRYKQYLTRRFI